MDGPLAHAFGAASQFFVAVVGSVPEMAWDAPGLGTWSLLELVGHANRAHTTIEEYLLRPRPPEPPGSSYFNDEAVEQRGRQAVAALGNDPHSAAAAASKRTISLIAETADDATISGPAGTMPLVSYLPTRIAELTIHGLDIMRVTGNELPVPAEALLASLRSVSDLVVRRGKGTVALLALSGRSPLPPGFSAY